MGFPETVGKRWEDLSWISRRKLPSAIVTIVVRNLVCSKDRHG